MNLGSRKSSHTQVRQITVVKGLRGRGMKACMSRRVSSSGCGIIVVAMLVIGCGCIKVPFFFQNFGRLSNKYTFKKIHYSFWACLFLNTDQECSSRNVDLYSSFKVTLFPWQQHRERNQNISSLWGLLRSTKICLNYYGFITSFSIWLDDMDWQRSDVWCGKSKQTIKQQLSEVKFQIMSKIKMEKKSSGYFAHSV